MYVSGFIRRYAECVGLDAQELVEEYRGELEAVSAQPPKTAFFKANKNNGNNTPPQPNYYNRQRIEKKPPNLIKVIPFYALWIVLILALIVYLVNRQSDIDQNQQDSSLLTLKQSTTSLGTKNIADSQSTQNQTANENSADQNSNPVNDGFRITVRAKNHVWAEVKAVSSGEALFNGFLEQGDTRDFVDKEGLRVRAGNGGNVIVTSAGKTSDLGAAGKITEKLFSADKNNQVVTTKPAPDNTETAKPNSSTSATTTAAQKSLPT